LQYNILAHKIPVHETTAVCTDYRNQDMELGNIEHFKIPGQGNSNVMLATCFHAGILLCLFNPEDGSNVPRKR
jgi:hypothetical protein